MQSELTQLYQKAINAVKKSSLLWRAEKKKAPQNFIVATHGPALIKALRDNPELLDKIGIYRVNCSHMNKEPDQTALAEYLKTLHPLVPILIDLQGPKPRIHEMSEEIQDKMIMRVGDTFEVAYAPGNSTERFGTYGHIKVCFPEIVNVMEVGDECVFDDGKMTAIVRGKSSWKAMLECTQIPPDLEKYILKGRKWISVRNKPLGVPCITYHDRKSIEFAKNILGYDYVDNVMVSYFAFPSDIDEFVKIMREEFQYDWNLGGKFETPHAVYQTEEIFSKNQLQLAMFGRGDLSVEMDRRAVENMHEIQSHFFALCQKYQVESICATGYLESMMTLEGRVQPSEIHDMQISMATHVDHLMLSGESCYGQQAKNCIETEWKYQKETYEKLQKWETLYRPVPESSLGELLYIDSAPLQSR